MPTRFLEENFKMILKDSLSRSNYAVKTNWKFQRIIVEKAITMLQCFRIFH